MHEERRLQMVCFSRQTHAGTTEYVSAWKPVRRERDQEFNIRANNKGATLMFTFLQLNWLSLLLCNSHYHGSFLDPISFLFCFFFSPAGPLVIIQTAVINLPHWKCAILPSYRFSSPLSAASVAFESSAGMAHFR